MASGKPVRPKRPIPVLHSERLLLTLPAPSMAKEHLRFAEENAEHLGRWEPPFPEGYFTQAFWREKLQRNIRDFKQGNAVRFSIFWKRDPKSPVLGNCNFNNFVWGAFHCATLGYRLDHRVVGQGVMSEALRCAI